MARRQGWQRFIAEILILSLALAIVGWFALHVAQAVGAMGDENSSALAATARLEVLLSQLDAAADGIVDAADRHDVGAANEAWESVASQLAAWNQASAAIVEVSVITANRERARRLPDLMQHWRSLVEGVRDAARAANPVEAQRAADMAERFSADVTSATLDDMAAAELEHLMHPVRDASIARPRVVADVALIVGAFVAAFLIVGVETMRRSRRSRRPHRHRAHPAFRRRLREVRRTRHATDGPVDHDSHRAA